MDQLKLLYDVIIGVYRVIFSNYNVGKYIVLMLYFYIKREFIFKWIIIKFNVFFSRCFLIDVDFIYLLLILCIV